MIEFDYNKKGGSKMFRGKKINFQKLVIKAAYSIAKMDANSACTYITYQPSIPDSAKKLRRF